MRAGAPRDATPGDEPADGGHDDEARSSRRHLATAGRGAGLGGADMREVLADLVHRAIERVPVDRQPFAQVVQRARRRS